MDGDKTDTECAECQRLYLEQKQATAAVDAADRIRTRMGLPCARVDRARADARKALVYARTARGAHRATHREVA